MSERKRAALVTGSGKNIGRACLLALAESGFNVVVNGSSDRTSCDTTAEEARALGVDALVVMADVGDKSACDAMAAEAISHFGGIDVLINNAAIRPSHTFTDITDEIWERVLDVNMNAAFRLSRACLPGMVERGWGRIVNFAGLNEESECHNRLAYILSRRKSSLGRGMPFSSRLEISLICLFRRGT